MNRRSLTFCGLVLLLAGGVVFAQRWQWGRGVGGITTERGGVPDWEVDEDFPGDLFTFVRIQYDSYGYRQDAWRIDYRDSDLNFSLRLSQLTTLNVNPEPIVLRLTDPKLMDYPFIYMVEPGGLSFSDAEVAALRKYCLNGGFLMVDDFWGDYQLENMMKELRRVFPDRDAFEVPLSHEIFHNVYDMKEKPQCPAVQRGPQYYGDRLVTWDWSRDGTDTTTPHYKAVVDDEDRIMVFVCHNTDFGDGWEREGNNTWYFEEFSVKRAYPMGINIVTYAMTH